MTVVSYMILLEAVQRLVVRSTRRFHVLHDGSKAGVMQSAAEERRDQSLGVTLIEGESLGVTFE